MSTQQKARQEFWFEHIQGWRASGLSQSAYCALHGLKIASLGYWISRDKAARVPLTLVPVSVAASAVRAGEGLVLHSPSGWSLSVPTNAPADWLGELLRRLR
jgi:hypothetical protein